MCAIRFLVPLAAAVATFAAPPLRAADDVELIDVPRFEDVKSKAMNWLAQQSLKDQAVLSAATAVWVEPLSPPRTAELFDRVISTFRIADPAAAAFLQQCDASASTLAPPDPKTLETMGDSEFLRTNLAQYCGVTLVQNRMYEEALAAFKLVSVKESADPPSYLFHLAVAQQQLLMSEEGLATLDTLLHRTEDVPSRYATIGELMKYDLDAMKPESLGEVAARMKDIERRLSLARGGAATQKKEEEVVTLLDAIIKKMEQQSGGGSGQGNGGNTNRPGGGAQDSVIKGSAVENPTVDKAKLKQEAGWGGLPDAKAAEAKNILKRDFPRRYRDAIEAYFRKTAGRKPQK